MLLRKSLQAAAVGLLLLTLAAEPSLAQGREVRLKVPKGYHNYDFMKTRIETLVKARPKILSRKVIGKSRAGRNIEALLLSSRDVNPETKPAILVVGNLAGDEAAGGEAVLKIAEFIVAALDKEPAFKALMVKRAIWLIPRPNPDATELLFRLPVRAQRRTLSPIDDDRDGDSDEDHSNDINNDGWILPMRIPDNNGPLVLDKLSGLLLRKAEIKKGEQGQYRVLLEGQDDDQDGLVNEDEFGGVDLDRNFPIHWQAADKVLGAGHRPLCDPESRALANFLLAHKNIGLVVHMHTNNHGALTAGKDPIPKGDKELYAALLKLYQESSKSTQKPLDAFHVPAGQGSSGTFQDFSYHGLGIISWPARIWMQAPEIISDPGDKTVSPALRRERQWLRYFKKKGQGFIDWKPFQHPLLGQVQIGGFSPFSVKTPPSDLLNEAITPVVRFVLNGATLLPEIELKGEKVKKLSKNVYQLTVEIKNRGFLPTQSARAKAVKRNAPGVLTIRLGDGDRIIMGQSRMVLPDIAGGQSIKRSLVISSGGRGPVVLQVKSPKGGVATLKVSLGKGV
jgi:hypothetical protein